MIPIPELDGLASFPAGDPQRVLGADLTLAALVAPVATLSQPGGDHPRLEPVRDALAPSGLLDWAPDIYARHRPPSAEVDVRVS